MYTLSNVPTPEIVTEPAGEPLTLTEAKNHCNYAASDTSPDSSLTSWISAARIRFERDCNIALITRTMRLKLFDFAEFRFPIGPVTAITSVTYYDSSNASQTLSSSYYSADTANDVFRLSTALTLPEVYDRWDAVTINYTIGRHANSTTVDALSKSAMLLLISHWDINRDMTVPLAGRHFDAYQDICRLLGRSSYP